MRNTNFDRKGVEFLILSTLVTLNSNNFHTKGSLNKRLKFMEFLNHFRFELK
jgi:hypothetical protein